MAAAEIQLHCSLMRIKTDKNMVHIILNLCIVSSAKYGIIGVLLEGGTLQYGFSEI